MTREDIRNEARKFFCLVHLLVYALKSTHSGIYATSYLSYFRVVLSIFTRYGLTAFVVLHQNVWSLNACRSGAPQWTLEQVDFDLSTLLLSSPSSALCGCSATSKQLNSKVIPTKCFRENSPPRPFSVPLVSDTVTDLEQVLL